MSASAGQALPFVVTGADEAYAGLVSGCLASLAAARQRVRFRIGVLDFGFTPETRAKVEQIADAVVTPEWPFKTKPDFTERAFSLATTTRLFIPDYFPGAPTYMWIDSDAFVLDPQGVQWFLRAASHAGLAVVPTVDRSYFHSQESLGWVKKRYAMAFGDEVADKMAQQPYVNSGVWAAAASGPVWAQGRSEFATALERWNGPRPSDQAIMNYLLYIKQLPHHRLPASCNWVSHLAKPLLDHNRRMLVEPSIPFAPLQIVHNTYNDKLKPRPFRFVDGRQTTLQLTFQGILNAFTALSRPQPT